MPRWGDATPSPRLISRGMPCHHWHDDMAVFNEDLSDAVMDMPYDEAMFIHDVAYVHAYVLSGIHVDGERPSLVTAFLVDVATRLLVSLANCCFLPLSHDAPLCALAYFSGMM